MIIFFFFFFFALPRTRTLGVTPLVTAISSLKEITINFKCGYKMLLNHLVVRFQKILTIGHSYHGLQSWDFRFFMSFFSPSPKKKFFFLFWLKISLYLFLIWLERIFFLTDLEGIFEFFWRLFLQVFGFFIFF
jgi:hypothetical protein